MIKKNLLRIVLLIAVVLLVVGCSDNGNVNNTEPNNNNTNAAEGNENEENNDGETNEPEEKTEISMMMHWGEELFEEKFNQHIKKALPHIDLKLIEASGTEEM